MALETFSELYALAFSFCIMSTCALPIAVSLLTVALSLTKSSLNQCYSNCGLWPGMGP